MTNAHALIALSPAISFIVFFLLLKLYLIHQTRAQIMNKLNENKSIIIPELEFHAMYVMVMVMVVALTIGAFVFVSGDIRQNLRHERIISGVEKVDLNTAEVTDEIIKKLQK